MDRGIWAIWYELPEQAGVCSEYLDWFHNVHIPDKLARGGYLWAAHYELGHGGARKLLAAAGWGKHSVLYEYTSLEAREERVVPHEEKVHEAGSWTARILPKLVHAPCSPAVGRRIWPAIG